MEVIHPSALFLVPCDTVVYSQPPHSVQLSVRDVFRRHIDGRCGAIQRQAAVVEIVRGSFYASAQTEAQTIPFSLRVSVAASVLL